MSGLSKRKLGSKPKKSFHRLHKNKKNKQTHNFYICDEQFEFLKAGNSKNASRELRKILDFLMNMNYEPELALDVLSNIRNHAKDEETKEAVDLLQKKILGHEVEFDE